MTYYHGSPTPLGIGAELTPGIIGGEESDPRADQLAVWATTTGPGMAWKWAERKIRYRHRLEVPRVWVYEVALTDVEPDPNGRSTDPGSVMARAGRVVRAVGSFLSSEEADAALDSG